ncbi:MAG TPA: signal recognition particle-docking protein FtsY [Chlamydiales bacterium]|nr:signal recognition particle-docking protein FtsY [Chlamydiales bacterium]
MFSFIKNKFKKITKSIFAPTFSIGGKIRSLFSKKIDEETYDELERILYEADLGVQTATKLCEIAQNEKSSDVLKILQKMKEYLLSIFTEPKEISYKKPHVIMVVGVNGSGKTTTIAKLAKKFQKEGKKVLLGAGDTYRAAAVEQLAQWAEKLNIDIIKSLTGGDPSALAYDACQAAIKREADILILDTAGRIHTKTDLMHELKKIKTVCDKVIPDAPHETLLVLDATTGQNAVDQAQIFNEYTPLSGIALTKLDGSAKGGIIVAIQKLLKIPVLWVGIGEKEEDLIPFNPEDFVDALLSLNEETSL